MDIKRIIWGVLLLGMTVCAAVIIGYYWLSFSLESISTLPVSMLAIALVYILLQLIKRAMLKIQNWWDWTYYIGLVSIVMPALFAHETNQFYFHLLTDVGSLFLLLPVVLDARKLFKKK